MSALSAKLWLVRHAQPLVDAGLCYGALDAPACPAKTQQVAQQLALALPQKAQVTTSPLLRCTQLAQALLALRPDLHLLADARLREMDFGAWEGRAWDSIAAADMAAWTADFAHHAPGGGESVAALMARVAQIWDEAGDEARTGTCATKQPRLWITHAGVMRATQLMAQGQRHITQADQWPAGHIDFGQRLEFALLQPGIVKK